MNANTSRAFMRRNNGHRWNWQVSPPRSCALCGALPAEYAVFTPKGRAPRIDVCWEDKAIIDYCDQDDGSLFK